MPDYDLTRLGSRAFEQLVVSLCHQEIGPGVQVFGDGPDGGREATFDGTIDWSPTVLGAGADGDDRWHGYTVLQSKFMLKPKARPRDNALWLQGQIRDELAHWTKAADERTRDRFPDYLIFVTNVDLSAVAQTGGIDTVAKYIDGLLGPGSDAYKAGLRIRGFKIWHGDQIRTMLDAHQDVRWAFDGLVAVGDVVAALLSERPELGSLGAEDPLRRDMVAGLTADRWVRLGQAGAGGGEKLWLDDVVVDLPGTLDDSTDDDVVPAARHVLERGDAVLRPRQPDAVRRTGVVLVGGPGHGKTTLSQLIAQAYRAAMLEAADLAPSTRVIVDAIRVALNRMGLSLPGNRRWPVRVDLAQYAEHLSSGVDTSLLRWISDRVSDRADVEVKPSQLNSWLRVCPWAVILDGLDEVPSLRARRELYEQIERFVAQAEDLDADLLVVVTTRPTGYDERLPEPRFEHLQLQPLPAVESAQLAARLAAKRFEDDPEMRAEVDRRMAAAAADDTTARLMETPLQVTVMSMIVEKFPTLPPDRFTLFELYYQTMYDREVAKGIVVSRFLSDHRQHIDRVHERVGLLLQVQAEDPEHAEAVLGPDELREVVTAWLDERGYESDEAAETADRMVEAALHRLVLLVPRGEGLGFEIRTLQELMAARAVTEGPDEQVIGRLRLLADNPHWRNTWLLAAGKLLTADRFEDLLTRMLRNLDDARESLGRRLTSGPALAAALLEDGLAARRPGFERALVLILLSVVDHPPVGELRGVAMALDRLLDGRYRDLVLDRLAGARASGAARRAAAATVMQLMSSLAGTPGRRHSIELTRDRFHLSAEEEAAVRPFLPPGLITAGDAGAEPVVAALLRAADGLGLDQGQEARLKLGLASLGEAQFEVVGTGSAIAVLCHVDVRDPYPLLELLDDHELAIVLELALDALPPEHWSIPALVAAVVHTARSRRPVGQQLMRTFGDGR